MVNAELGTTWREKKLFEDWFGMVKSKMASELVPAIQKPDILL